jgi:LPXTG-motif cell wall-anchored protein
MVFVLIIVAALIGANNETIQETNSIPATTNTIQISEPKVELDLQAGKLNAEKQESAKEVLKAEVVTPEISNQDLIAVETKSGQNNFLLYLLGLLLFFLIAAYFYLRKKRLVDKKIYPGEN